MKPVLVINSGSSSLKYQVIDVSTQQSLLAGNIERVSNHSDAFRQMLEALNESGLKPRAIGHRVVHGGSRFAAPTTITPEVVAEIEALVPLAPLHNPGNLAGIRGALAAFPAVPQVAVFDTAFHQSMPPASYRFAINRQLADRHHVRRYGFHGSSYAYVTKRTAELLGRPLEQLNAVVLHLGNGASTCAIQSGRSYDTSMGLTPLQGLVMGTRSGDIDPAAIFYLSREAGMGLDELDSMLNKESGLLGLSGLSDMRDVVDAALANNSEAAEALDIYVQRVKHYVGAYVAELGRVDALVFTAGIGENSSYIRERVCENLAQIGIEIEASRNEVKSSEAREIGSWKSRIRVLVVPTNEELEIALQTYAVNHEDGANS